VVSLKCGGADDISIWERFKGRNRIASFLARSFHRALAPLPCILIGLRLASLIGSIDGKSGLASGHALVFASYTTELLLLSILLLSMMAALRALEP
jgi:hypothetical protein